MAVWKKVLTHNSAVDDTDGLKINAVDGADSSSEKIQLSDGSNTDEVVIAVAAGLSIARSDDTITLTNTITDSQLTEEEVEDIVGGMLGGTETGITVTYVDGAGSGDGAINFVVTDQTLASSTSNTNNVTLTMSQHSGTSDTVEIVAGSNITLTNNSAGQFTIEATDTNTQLSEEEVEDIVGGMLGGTETGIAVTYVDGGVGAGTISFVVADQTLTSSTSNTNNVTLSMSNPSGTADTVEIVAGDNITLTNNSDGQFTIEGSATASNVSVTDSDVDETAYLVFTTSTSGSAALKVDSSTLQYNASSDTLTVNNLTVAGTQTTVNTSELVVADKNIVIADGSAAASDANGAGITVDIASTLANMPQFLWNNGGQLTGWTLSNYNASGNTDVPVSVMEFSANSTAPAGDAGGVGSFHFDTGDDKLYIRTS